MATPLMPHATAAWLVDNTGLSFSQIAEFCGIHILEVQAMADDLFAVVQSGAVKIRIDQRYPLAEVAQAHRDLEARKTTGSSVLLV